MSVGETRRGTHIDFHNCSSRAPSIFPRCRRLRRSCSRYSPTALCLQPPVLSRQPSAVSPACARVHLQCLCAYCSACVCALSGGLLSHSHAISFPKLKRTGLKRATTTTATCERNRIIKSCTLRRSGVQTLFPDSSPIRESKAFYGILYSTLYSVQIHRSAAAAIV